MITTELKEPTKPLVFAHIGDLHITLAKEQNYIDLLSIIAQIEIACSNQLDFVILPGDNADNGLPDQYKLVATAVKMLSTPVHVIPGDHDMEQGGLQNFNMLPFAAGLPKAIDVKKTKCLFLDVSGPGEGGPDFRMGEAQLQWLQNELMLAKNQNQGSVIFMHTYPDDLKDKTETARLNKLIADNEVVLVDMGHTHYNELANDGHTIFSATRSTGQIEEGPVGYSLVAVDSGVVSWRFKALHEAFPFVMITSPADHRLVRKADQLVTGTIVIKAIVFGAKKTLRVKCKIEAEPWVTMAKTVDDGIWLATINVNNYTDALLNLTVEAVDETGRPGQHIIQIATSAYHVAKQSNNGSDAATIGAWPENGIFGTQLGPNRNGKPS